MRLFKLASALALTCLFISSSVIAQENRDIPFEDLPENYEYGKCYAKCKIPDQYETVSVQKLAKDATVRLEKIPAEYKTVSEQVMVKEGRKEYKTVPATYKTITEKVQIEPAKTSLRTIPAQYKAETRKVMIAPAHGEWVKKKKSPNCFSSNPEDCYVVCYEEIPAKYNTETYQVLVKEASTTETVTPAKYKTITKRVVDQPARVEEVNIPAVYKTVTSKALVSAESTRQETIPAVYKTVQEKRLVSKGGYTVWTEILCAAKTGSSKVSSIQRALKSKGYDPGPIDGIMGVKTQTALTQFQTDNSLPVGNLNMESLKALGVEG